MLNLEVVRRLPALDALASRKDLETEWAIKGRKRNARYRIRAKTNSFKNTVSDMNTETMLFGKVSHVRFKRFRRRRRKCKFHKMLRKGRLHKKLRSRFCDLFGWRQSKKFHWKFDESLKLFRKFPA